MRPISCKFGSAALVAVLAVALTAACGSPLGLPRASANNVVDTVSLFALSGTPITAPSAYRLFSVFSTLPVAQPAVARTDQTSDFDFAFDIDTLGRALLLPTAVLRLGRLSGAQIDVATPFDSIKIAPTANYQLDSALVVDTGSVVIVHSRPVTCPFGIPATYYAKLHVFRLDTTSAPNGRRIDFEILVSVNCGYRGLEPGLPSR